VLVLLFVKYVSDKYADVPGAPIEVPQWRLQREELNRFLLNHAEWEY
jgi:hypothetical protein